MNENPCSNQVIHVLIEPGIEHRTKLENKLKMNTGLFDKALSIFFTENVADQTDYFADAFICTTMTFSNVYS